MTEIDSAVNGSAGNVRDESTSVDFVTLLYVIWKSRVAIVVGVLLGLVLSLFIWNRRLNSQVSQEIPGYWVSRLITEELNSESVKGLAKIYTAYLQTRTGSNFFYSHLNAAIGHELFKPSEWATLQTTGQGLIKNIEEKDGIINVRFLIPAGIEPQQFATAVTKALNAAADDINGSYLLAYEKFDDDKIKIESDLDQFRFNLLTRFDSLSQVSPALRTAVYTQAMEKYGENYKLESIEKIVYILPISIDEKRLILNKYSLLLDSLEKLSVQKLRIARNLKVSILKRMQPLSSEGEASFEPWQDSINSKGPLSYVVIAFLGSIIGAVIALMFSVIIGFFRLRKLTRSAG